MNRLSLSALALAAAAALAGCTAAPAMNDPADLAALNALRTKYVNAVNAGDAATIADLYVANGVSMPNHNPMATGKDGILAANKAFFAMSPKMELMADQTMTMGTHAIERGHFKVTLNPPGAPPMTDEGHYVVAFEKGADGNWKALFDIDNSSMPMPPPPPPAPTTAPTKGKGK